MAVTTHIPLASSVTMYNLIRPHFTFQKLRKQPTPLASVLLETLTAHQEIPPFSWDATVHYRVHKNPQLVSILNTINPVHTTLSQFIMLFHARFRTLKRAQF
jgi:hypothetical protein